MNTNKRLIIIDGSSLLSTSFYATATAYTMARTQEDKEKALEKLLKTSTGIYTNGVYTFMKILLKIIDKQKPTHLAIVWDITRDSFRRCVQGGKTYKGTRKETPNPLKEQFKTTQNLLKDILPQYMSKANLPNGDKTPQENIYEADDFAGSLTKRFEGEIPVFLYTKDEDYLQLINYNARVWLVTSKADEFFNTCNLEKDIFNIPDGTFEFTLTSLKDIKGLDPLQIIDNKALCGDTADNIIGVKMIGPKASIPLLNEYDTIETIYSTIEDLNKTEEKELTKFFKEKLGISRSPIGYLSKEGIITLSNEEQISYKPITRKLTEEDIEVNKLIETKFGKLKFPIEIITQNGLATLQNNDIVNIDYSAKEMAFISKELATIKTDIEEIKDLKLEDICLNIDYDKLKSRLLELEIKSLI